MRRIFFGLSFVLKNNFGKIGFLAVLLVSMACAGGYYDYNMRTNISRDVFVPAGFDPLGYYEDSRFAWGEDQFDSPEKFDAYVVEEWSSYLGDQKITDNLWKLIIEDSMEAIQLLREGLSKKQMAGAPKFVRFLDYLVLAKKAESYSMKSWYWWETKNTDSLSRIVAEDFVRAWKTTDDDFIRYRLEFQIIRNSFFSGNYLRGIDFYNRYVSGRSPDLMHLRCLSYTAGCYHRMERYTEANALYADLMAYDKRFTQSACQSFHPQDDLDFMKALQLCSSDEARICAWVMMAQYSGDDSRAMREIRVLNADHPAIDLLMARELAKFEVYALEDINGWRDAADQSLVAFLRIRTQEDLLSLADDPGYTRKYKVYAGLAYLFYLTGKTEDAETYLQRAWNAKPQDDTLFKDQLRIFRVLIRLGNPEQLSDEDIADLDWIFSGAGEWWSENAKSVNTFRAYTLALDRLYGFFSGKNDPAAVILKPSFEDLEDNRKVYEAIAFLESGNEAGIYLFCQKYAGLSKEELYRWASINHVFAGELEEALEAAKKCGGVESGFVGDPFSYRIKDCHDCDFEEYSGPLYNRVSFLDSLVQKTERVEKHPAFADVIALGNAFYNLTYYGNFRQYSYVDYPRHGYSNPQFDEYPFYPKHYDTSGSSAYYDKALTLAKNKEERALALFLKSKCELSEFYNSGTMSDSVHFVVGPAFEALKEMENTQFRKMVIAECGYFKTYFNRK